MDNNMDKLREHHSKLFFTFSSIFLNKEEKK